MLWKIHVPEDVLTGCLERDAIRDAAAFVHTLLQGNNTGTEHDPVVNIVDAGGLDRCSDGYTKGRDLQNAAWTREKCVFVLSRLTCFYPLCAGSMPATAAVDAQRYMTLNPD